MNLKQVIKVVVDANKSRFGQIMFLNIALPTTVIIGLAYGRNCMIALHSGTVHDAPIRFVTQAAIAILSSLLAVPMFLWWISLGIGGTRYKLKKNSDSLICSRCKYDLRGSISSGQCPECGLRFYPANDKHSNGG